MSPPREERLRVALLAFDFIELCVPLANALSTSADVLLIHARQALGTFRNEIDEAVHVTPIDFPRLRQPVRNARMCGAVLRAVRNFGADVVHVQEGQLWLNFLGLPWLRRRALVMTIHDPVTHAGDRSSGTTPQWVWHVGFRQAHHVIVHAAAVKRQLLAHDHRAADSVHVVPHIAISAPEDVAAEADGLTVLFFGRIWPYKGLDYLIRAQPAISARVPHARFVIAGAGEDFSRYRAMMEDPARFTVINARVSAQTRAELFASADVVVLPYVEATQSGVVPLAYRYAKPVVATHVGGLPEAVEDGRTGLLVPPRNSAALADAVVRLLEDPGLRHAMGAAGRDKLQREASPGAVAEQTLRVYEAALAGRAGHSGPESGLRERRLRTNMRSSRVTARKRNARPR